MSLIWTSSPTSCITRKVFADVPHRQWVFTIPKRFRIYFRFDRSLLGKLCRAAFDTVREVYALGIDGNLGIAAMVGAVQTFGDLIHWHPHIHAIVADGVFTETRHFVRIDETWKRRTIDIWRDKVFDMRLDEKKIDLDTVSGMKAWKNSGFSVDNSVIIAAEDKEGMQRLVEYISRCPFSLTRIISTTKKCDILYRASNPQCIAFPIAGDQVLTAGNPRNFEVFKPLDFLANVTQHIPDKGEHQIRYYGFYSNKKRGMRGKKDPTDGKSQPSIPEGDTTFVKKCKMTWATL